MLIQQGKTQTELLEYLGFHRLDDASKRKLTATTEILVAFEEGHTKNTNNYN